MIEPGKVTEAQRLIEQDKRNRATACQREIDESLQRNDCRITAVPFITEDGRIDANIVIVPQDAATLPDLAPQPT